MDLATLRIRAVTERVAEMAGRSREALTGTAAGALFQPGDAGRIERALRSLADAGEGASVEERVRLLRAGGTALPVEASAAALPRAGSAPLAALALRATDAGDGDGPAVSGSRLRSLVAGIPQLVWCAMEDGRWSWSSPQWTAFTGLAPEASAGLGWLDAVHPDDRDASLAAWAAAQEGATFDIEHRLMRRDTGEERWFRSRAVPVADPACGVVEWLGTSTDIDDLRRLQEAQARSVAELQHRTRNLIAVVSAVANQTLHASATLDEFRGSFLERLSALSRVQSLLSASGTRPVTFDAVVRSELRAHALLDDERVRLSGPDVTLRNSLVQILSLALNELARNAIRHGAFSGRDGSLSVEWRVDADERGRWLAIVWTESGLAPPTPGTEQPAPGFGRELIERALPYQIGARTSFDLSPGGLRATIDLPLDRRSAP